MRRGGGGLQRPGVVLVAARSCPHPGIVRGHGSLCLQLASCRSSAGAISCAAIVRARSGPGAGDVLRAPFDRLDERAAFARVLRPRAHLPERLVDQECRGHEARGARGLYPAELAVELLRIRLESCEVGLGVGGVLDSMLGVEKPRDIEIRADVLNDHIGRVAPASDGHIAVGEREPLERRRIGAPNDLDAGAGGVGEPGRVEGVDPLQVRTKLARDPLLSLRRAIAELRSKGRSRAGVDAKRRRALRRERRRLSASWSSSASASASVVADDAGAGSRVHPGSVARLPWRRARRWLRGGLSMSTQGALCQLKCGKMPCSCCRKDWPIAMQRPRS